MVTSILRSGTHSLQLKGGPRIPFEATRLGKLPSEVRKDILNLLFPESSITETPDDERALDLFSSVYLHHNIHTTVLSLGFTCKQLRDEVISHVVQNALFELPTADYAPTLLKEAKSPVLNGIQSLMLSQCTYLRNRPEESFRR